MVRGVQVDQSPAPSSSTPSPISPLSEEADPLEQPLNSSRDLRSGGEPVIGASLPRNRLERDAEMQPFDDDPANGNCRKADVSKCRAAFIAIVVVLVVMIIVALVTALGVEKSRQLPPCPAAASQCPDGWFRNQGKCYYFSKAKGNWTYSQNFCSSHAASLAGIDNLQELDSLLPYKGKLEHWIGLRKDTDQVWKWANGTEFDNRQQRSCAALGDTDCGCLHANPASESVPGILLVKMWHGPRTSVTRLPASSGDASFPSLPNFCGAPVH